MIEKLQKENSQLKEELVTIYILITLDVLNTTRRTQQRLNTERKHDVDRRWAQNVQR